MNSTGQNIVASYIGKCRTKGCKTALRVDDVVASYRSAGTVMSWPDVYVAPGGNPIGGDVLVEGTGYVLGNDGAHGYCAEHQRVFPLRAVKGRFVESIICTAKCRNATGPNCNCSCGGANHGAGHSH